LSSVIILSGYILAYDNNYLKKKDIYNYFEYCFR
jgi:hypothetical protein